MDSAGQVSDWNNYTAMCATIFATTLFRYVDRTSVDRSPIWMGLESGQWKRCNYRLTHMCERTTVFICRTSSSAHSSPPHSL